LLEFLQTIFSCCKIQQRWPEGFCGSTEGIGSRAWLGHTLEFWNILEVFQLANDIVHKSTVSSWEPSPSMFVCCLVPQLHAPDFLFDLRKDVDVSSALRALRSQSDRLRGDEDQILVRLGVDLGFSRVLVESVSKHVGAIGKNLAGSMSKVSPSQAATIA
jgi:hypothetical protein